MAIAHRGASSYAPENTMAAFDLAIVMGARHIELDVHSTSDGHVVVIRAVTKRGGKIVKRGPAHRTSVTA